MQPKFFLIGAAASAAVAASTADVTPALSATGNSDSDLDPNSPDLKLHRDWWLKKSQRPRSHPATPDNPFGLSPPVGTCPKWQWNAPPVQMIPTGNGHCCLPRGDRDSLNCCRFLATPMLTGWNEHTCGSKHWQTAENYKRFRSCNTGLLRREVCDRDQIPIEDKLLNKYRPQSPENLNPIPQRKANYRYTGTGYSVTAHRAVVFREQQMEMKPKPQYQTPPDPRLHQFPNGHPEAEPESEQLAAPGTNV
ncbi:hypothetical protein PspLS_07120 [Pyricularia sp. CBS 133598]|nr:hypothetical protein PspLS_07120 [Pyricularia sp. CBS 133598]